MSNKLGITCPFLVHDNMTRKTHTVTEITDTGSGRWYWIDGKAYKSSGYTVVRTDVKQPVAEMPAGFAFMTETYGKGTPVNDSDFCSSVAA